jgi:glycerol-3-phosphate dehydrogenase subunit C
MTQSKSEKILRGVLEACADCDTCRFLMDESCLFFPELYRLYDKEKEMGSPVKDVELQKLSELCTFCGLCPCPNIRSDVIQGKTERVHKEGMPLGIRLLADVQRFGRWGSLAPKVFNSVLSNPSTSHLARKIVGIHPQRKLPQIAHDNFFAWARKRGLDRETGQFPKVAYFAGCTAGYFFPEVARATVAVLAHNGVSVFVPPQQCCGMPTLLEGDQHTTLKRVRSNLKMFLKTVQAGYDLVCSCPTCGYFMKVPLKERACFSKVYQESVNAGSDVIMVPGCKAGKESFVYLKKSIYEKILKDDGYFSDIDPLDRMALSKKLMDMGEYLDRLYDEKRLNLRFGKLGGRMVYYAPCHQREQGIGSPYEKLLALIPGLTIKPVGSAMDCCGMGGSLGFKKDFHEASVKLGKPLMQKIQAAEPTAIITDCLSCRLQFQHMLPFPVYHPLEIISGAYEAFQSER